MKILAVLFAFMLATMANATPGQLEQFTIKIGPWYARETRVFYVYEPTTRGPQAPLVVGFHGGGGNGDTFMSRAGWIDVAEATGTVMIFPNGLNQSWNYGGDMSNNAERNSGDDMTFLDRIFRDYVPKYDINPARVYAMGVSAGGMMAYREVCERPGRFAAMGVVAAAMQVKSCPGAAGTSLYHLHGDADQNVPMAGGVGTETAAGVSYTPTATAIATFVAANGCGGAPAVEQIAQDTFANLYPCPSEEVTLSVVQGGPHGYDISPYLDETATLEAFFQRH